MNNTTAGTWWASLALVNAGLAQTTHPSPPRDPDLSGGVRARLAGLDRGPHLLAGVEA
jgi:hypothetical protein